MCALSIYRYVIDCSIFSTVKLREENKDILSYLILSHVSVKDPGIRTRVSVNDPGTRTHISVKEQTSKRSQPSQSSIIEVKFFFVEM